MKDWPPAKFLQKNLSLNAKASLLMLTMPENSPPPTYSHHDGFDTMEVWGGYIFRG